MFKKSLLLVSIFILLICTSTNAVGLSRQEQASKLADQISFQDRFIPAKLGTVPLPADKQMAYPYPAGKSRLLVDFPSVVKKNQPFNISITFQTTDIPFSALMLFYQMHIPTGTNLPTWWRQINISPWAPSDNTDMSGNIESLPSVDWVKQNWSSWYGVGIAPTINGSLLMHTSQGWHHGHYFFAWSGDSVTLTYGPFSFSRKGIYQFEIAPNGWYLDAHSISSNLEPVSFIVKVGKAKDDDKLGDDEDEQEDEEEDFDNEENEEEAD